VIEVVVVEQHRDGNKGKEEESVSLRLR
jgi:hypothetical protein